MKSYAYKPLDFSSDAIRVLRLFFNSDFDSGIRCELIETRLGDVPYEAVSYTWGSMDKPCKITLNGFEFYVTEHLYTALQHLRLPNRNRYLWVDAICIDQDNVEERGHQVGQMRLVYEKAKGVLIWLGISDPGIDELFMTINPPKQVERVSIEPDSYSFRTDLQGIVSKVMARPWFRRVWIIQEVASSTVATVVCGHHSVSTRKFKSILYYDKIVVPRHCQEILSIMPGPPRLCSWWAWEGKRDLHTLLVKFAASEATDERDKIYALLGISSDTYNSEVLFPDYRKNTQQVIHDTWSYLLFHEILDPSLHGFPHLSMTEFLLIIEHLPEWTAEWSIRERRDEVALRLVGAKGKISQMHADRRALLCSWAGRVCDDYFFRRIISHHKVDVNVVDGLGNSPLHIAVQNGQLDKVEALLKRKDILINTANHARVTPLVKAVQRGQKAIVNLLLAHPHIDEINVEDANLLPLVHAIPDRYCYTPRQPLDCGLENARSHVKVARRKRRSPKSATKAGSLTGRLTHNMSPFLSKHAPKTPASVPAALIVAQLTPPAANQPPLDAPHKDRTVALARALARALEEGREHVTFTLFGRQAADGVINENGQRYPTNTMNLSFTAAVEAILMCKDVYLNINFRWNECFRWSCWPGGDDWEYTLYGCDRDVGQMSTPLFLSVMWENEEMAKTLLKNGADIEKKSHKDCMSPLAMACLKGDASMARLLLDHGACVDSETRGGRTILELAAFSEKADIVYLLFYGASCRYAVKNRWFHKWHRATVPQLS